MERDSEWSWVESPRMGLIYRVLIGGTVLWVLLNLDIVIPLVKLALTPTLPE